MAIGRKFSSGREALVGHGIVYDLPIQLDPSPYKGAVVAGRDAEHNINLYFSDGVEWRQHIAETTIQEEIQRTIDDLILNGFDEADLPDPTLLENLRRFALNQTNGLPGFVWNDQWNYLTDEARASEIANEVFEGSVQILDEAIEVTVGATGDFLSLSDALASLLPFAPVVKSGSDWPLGRVRILSGTIISEQVFLIGVNLGWVEIVSDDAEVPVDASSLTEAMLLYPSSEDRAFINGFGAVMPLIECMFVETGTPVMAQPAHTVGIDIRNCTLNTKSTLPEIQADDSETDGDDVEAATLTKGFKGFGMAGRLAGSSTGRLDSILFQGADRGSRAASLRVQTSSIMLIRSRVKGGGQYNLLISESGRCNINSVSFRRQDGIDGNDDLVMSGGGHANVRSTSRGEYAQAANVITDGGIIYDNRVSFQSYPVRGSTPDGDWVRFADGTQVCTSPVISGAADAVGVGTYDSPYSTTNLAWSFPAAFVETPAVHDHSWISLNNNDGCNANIPNAVTTSTGSFRIVSLSSGTAGDTANTRLTARGRWL